MTVANGDQLECGGMCKQTPMTIAPSEFAVDFYIIPLTGFDVILGMQWLSTLGPYSGILHKCNFPIRQTTVELPGLVFITRLLRQPCSRRRLGTISWRRCWQNSNIGSLNRQDSPPPDCVIIGSFWPTMHQLFQCDPIATHTFRRTK